MLSTTTTDVPWDVVTDILSRLPVKSLIRFRSVAKSFNTLFKDPEFISSHLHHRSSANGSLLLVHTDWAVDAGDSLSLISLKTFDFAVDPHFPFPEYDSTVLVVGSCNGIVCMFLDHASHIMLWNPSTRDHQILPSPLLPYSLNRKASSPNFNSIGFGFHNGEYKVVRIVSDSMYNTDLAKIEIYSTVRSSWREINSNLPCKIRDFTCSVIIKGTPYWRVYESDNLQKRFVSFDMTTEVFQTTYMPWPNSEISGRNCGVGTVNDHFAVYFYNLYYDEEDDDRSIDIWAVNDENSDKKLTKLFVIRNFPVPGWPLGLYEDGLFIWKKSEGSSFSSSSSPADLIVYSPQATNEVKSIKCLKDIEDLEAFSHLESLVWIDAGNERSS